jgi:deazaflavin-dependent oxidoreductase (nitroreductase family)
MDAATAAALAGGGTAEIVTTGRKTGLPRRVVVGFHHLDGEWYITGRPGYRRDWLANLIAHPRFTLHLSASDVEAVAEPITDEAERERVLYRILTEAWGNPPEKAQHILPRWVAGAPLVRFRPL